jgi:HD-GYP domain-containing protein (c-di-GMP phosphodiesterase class II)
MTRPRVYREALSAADALLELDRCRGTQFDPHVIGVLKQLVAH